MLRCGLRAATTPPVPNRIPRPTFPPFAISLSQRRAVRAERDGCVTGTRTRHYRETSAWPLIATEGRSGNPETVTKPLIAPRSTKMSAAQSFPPGRNPNPPPYLPSTATFPVFSRWLLPLGVETRPGSRAILALPIPLPPLGPSIPLFEVVEFVVSSFLEQRYLPYARSRP